MTKVILREDCGNSPKNILVQDLTIALVKGDTKFILKKVTDDIRWNLVGDRLVAGKEKIREILKQMKNHEATELALYHIATHGQSGAADGTIKFKNGKTIAYCNIYEFNNTKGTLIREISSYEIELK